MLINTRELYGQKLVATDAEMGPMQNCYFGDRSGAFRRVIVETGHWCAGRKIQVSTGKTGRVSHPEAKLFVQPTRAEIKETAKATPATTGTVKQTAGQFID